MISIQRTIRLSLTTIVVIWLSGLASSAGTLYVWQDSPSPGPPYADWATAAHTIQAAVDAASAGDVVLVTNGVYAAGGRAVHGTMTNRVVIDKAVTVQSVTGPHDTSIEGYGTGQGSGNGATAIRCVYLGDNALLSGFTLFRGHTKVSGPTQEYREYTCGGGVFSVSSGVVTNCILYDNSAEFEGGGSYGGTLIDCVLRSNEASVGGGAAGPHSLGTRGATLLNSTLTDNRAQRQGGGTVGCTLYNCTVSLNNARSGGGGAYESTLYGCLIDRNVLAAGTGIDGGGTMTCILYNCTVTRNSAYFGGVANSTIYNSIVYYNSGESNHDLASTFYYSCTTPLPAGGVGNVAAEPGFVSSGNLRLQSFSPCIDTGTDLSASISTDLDGNTRPLDGNVDGIATFDMGAYEFTPGNNHPPQLTVPGNQTVDEGILLNVSAAATDPDAGDTLTFSLVTPPSGATINASTGAISWTPGEGQGPGVFTFTVRVTDNGAHPLSETKSFTTTVNEVNRPPILTVPPDGSIVEGGSYFQIVSASDTDYPQNNLTFSLVMPPDGMTLTVIDSDNPRELAIHWTPTAAQGLGDFTITVQVQDNGNPSLSDTKSFTITVIANRPVIANPDQAVRKSGQSVKIKGSTLTKNDTDPDFQLLTVVSVNSPSVQGGAVTFKDGWVYYQPPSGSDPLADSFTYVVSDTLGSTATGTVTVSVAPPSIDLTLNVVSVTGGYPNPAIVLFAGIPGRTYTIQSSPVMNPATWTSLGTVTVGSNGIGEFTDIGAATEPTLFYRALQP